MSYWCPLLPGSCQGVNELDPLEEMSRCSAAFFVPSDARLLVGLAESRVDQIHSHVYMYIITKLRPQKSRLN